MQNRFGEDCLWEQDQQAEICLESLQTILNCASKQGCRRCVPCSEEALDLFLKAARDRAGHS